MVPPLPQSSLSSTVEAASSILTTINDNSNNNNKSMMHHPFSVNDPWILMLNKLILWMSEEGIMVKCEHQQQYNADQKYYYNININNNNNEQQPFSSSSTTTTTIINLNWSEVNQITGNYSTSTIKYYFGSSKKSSYHLVKITLQTGQVKQFQLNGGYDEFQRFFIVMKNFVAVSKTSAKPATIKQRTRKWNIGKKMITNALSLWMNKVEYQIVHDGHNQVDHNDDDDNNNKNNSSSQINKNNNTKLSKSLSSLEPPISSSSHFNSSFSLSKDSKTFQSISPNRLKSYNDYDHDRVYDDDHGYKTSTPKTSIYEKAILENTKNYDFSLTNSLVLSNKRLIQSPSELEINKQDICKSYSGCISILNQQFRQGNLKPSKIKLSLSNLSSLIKDKNNDQDHDADDFKIQSTITATTIINKNNNDNSGSLSSINTAYIDLPPLLSSIKIIKDYNNNDNEILSKH